MICKIMVKLWQKIQRKMCHQMASIAFRFYQKSILPGRWGAWLPVNSSHSCLVTQSTRHKWAHKKAFSCRRGSVQKQCSTRTLRRQEDMQEGVSENKWPEKCRTKKGLEFDGLKNKGQIVKKISQSVDVVVQQQQTESMSSSTDTRSEFKPSVTSA